MMKNTNKNNDLWKSIWANFLDKTEEKMLRVLSERKANSICKTMGSDKQFRDELHHKMCSQLNKSMKQIMSSSSKQSPFEQVKTSTNVPTKSFERRTPDRATEQVKIDPFGVSLSNMIISANTTHTNKFKSTFSAVLDPFGSDEIDATLNPTNKWKKGPEVDSIFNGSLKMTFKHKKRVTDEFDPPSKQPQIKRLQFYCLYCTNYESFESIQHVNNHWCTKHSTELPQKPFRFFASEMTKCFYCHEMNPAIHIKQHHHDFHSDDIPMVTIAADNQFECGICKYVGIELINHFKSIHSDVILTPAFNPTKLSDETMSDLLKIDIHQKFKCKLSELIFNNGNLLPQHFLDKHAEFSAKEISIQLSNDMKNINYICGGCNQEITLDDYKDHLAMHLSRYECLSANCSFSVENLKVMLVHNIQVHGTNGPRSERVAKIIDQSAEIYFKTKMIFSNGLVLEKFNLMDTQFDDSANYSNFINHFRIKQFNDLQIRLIKDN